MRLVSSKSRADTRVDAGGDAGGEGLARAAGAAALRYREFIDACAAGAGEYRLTPRAETTAFARCFAVFGLRLVGMDDLLGAKSAEWSNAIVKDLDAYRQVRLSAVPDGLKTDKFYLQLLSFSLSALGLLGRLQDNPLEDHVVPLLSADVHGDLRRIHALEGRAGSGNLAMFMAILLIHARDCLGGPVQARIDEWLDLHIGHMNRFGYWGEGGMTHLQFQNGYHQYEIFEYLGAHNPRADAAGSAVLSLADAHGHFAPYPGGGGCYDYDAVFILTANGAAFRHKAVLTGTAHSILSEQNPDGGFAESHCVRPLTAQNLGRMLQHIVQAPSGARKERARLAAALLRPKHRRIHTHWSRYSRQWNESNLWDSWFRMLALARIEAAFDPPAARKWGFMSYPGIGYHPSARELQTTA